MITVTCPNCASTGQVADDKIQGTAIRCSNCGKGLFVEPHVPLEPSEGIQRAHSKFAGETRACEFCGEEILPVARKCKHCGEFLEWNGVAACLSFFWPGLGQIYKGTLWLGLAWDMMIFMFYVCPAAIALSANLPYVLILVLPGFFFHFLCIRDAGRTTLPSSKLPYGVLRVMSLVLVGLVTVYVVLLMSEKSN